MRRDAVENRHRIVTATVEAVAAGGTSVPAAEIAERAGVGTSTLYRHYPDRSALLAGCSVWGWQRIDGLIRRRTAQAPTRAAVRGVLAEVVEMMLWGDGYLEATGERVGRTPVDILPWKDRAEASFDHALARAARAGEIAPGVHAAGLLELTMTIREERNAAERLDLLTRAMLPGPDGR